MTGTVLSPPSVWHEPVCIVESSDYGSVHGVHRTILHLPDGPHRLWHLAEHVPEQGVLGAPDVPEQGYRGGVPAVERGGHHPLEVHGQGGGEDGGAGGEGRQVAPPTPHPVPT